jgi:uncharacterized protein (TIGR01777 family)
MNKTQIILAGGSGFLGRLLASRFVSRGMEVIVLSRRSANSAQEGVTFVPWDGATIGAWARDLEGAKAVINLAGRSVNCRYNAANRRLILYSRVNSTRVLGDAISACQRPPPVWLNSSTATIYKHSFDIPMDETNGMIGAVREAKDAFSVEVACRWERALEETKTPRTRKVAMRTGMVLGLDGNSVFGVLRRLVRAGLGGAMGSGRQYVSWMHESDFCDAIEWLLSREELSGPVNLTAPNPVPNREMMRTFREICAMRFGLPATRWMLEVGAVLLRTETELIIKSRRVVPARLLDSGFKFQFPELRKAVQDLEARVGE